MEIVKSKQRKNKKEESNCQISSSFFSLAHIGLLTTLATLESPIKRFFIEQVNEAILVVKSTIAMFAYYVGTVNC